MHHRKDKMAGRKSKKVTDDTSIIKEERAAERAAEVYSQEESQELSGQLVNDEEIVSAEVERGADADEVIPAEVSAMHTDTVVAQEASGDVEPADVPEEIAPKQKKQRSVKYKKAMVDLNLDRNYPLEEALLLAAARAYTTFDATVELHIRLLPQKKKDDQGVRGLIQLPHGSGKQVKVAILTEELIDEIAKTKKTDYDVLIAAPSLMPKVAKVAKILGPQGKMPSPKAGTVSDAPEEAAKAFQSGRVEYRADAGGNIHLPIGKASWTAAQLTENAQVVLSSLPRIGIAAVTVAATMGPGVRVNLSSL